MAEIEEHSDNYVTKERAILGRHPRLAVGLAKSDRLLESG